jgi:hypothetical protein
LASKCFAAIGFVLEGFRMAGDQNLAF